MNDEMVTLSQKEFDELTQENDSIALPEGNKIVILPEELFHQLRAARAAKRKEKDRAHRRLSARTVRAQRNKRKGKR